eukprot:15464414-Alexandrium_andersonii.AAC.1
MTLSQTLVRMGYRPGQGLVRAQVPAAAVPSQNGMVGYTGRSYRVLRGWGVARGAPHHAANGGEGGTAATEPSRGGQGGALPERDPRASHHASLAMARAEAGTGAARGPLSLWDAGVG